jgi:hypothetical protein
MDWAALWDHLHTEDGKVVVTFEEVPVLSMRRRTKGLEWAELGTPSPLFPMQQLKDAMNQSYAAYDPATKPGVGMTREMQARAARDMAEGTMREQVSAPFVPKQQPWHEPVEKAPEVTPTRRRGKD